MRMKALEWQLEWEDWLTNACKHCWRHQMWYCHLWNKVQRKKLAVWALQTVPNLEGLELAATIQNLEDRLLHISGTWCDCYLKGLRVFISNLVFLSASIATTSRFCSLFCFQEFARWLVCVWERHGWEWHLVLFGYTRVHKRMEESSHFGSGESHFFFNYGWFWTCKVKLVGIQSQAWLLELEWIEIGIGIGIVSWSTWLLRRIDFWNGLVLWWVEQPLVVWLKMSLNNGFVLTWSNIEPNPPITHWGTTAAGIKKLFDHGDLKLPMMTWYEIECTFIIIWLISIDLRIKTNTRK